MPPDDYLVTRPFRESNVGSNLASMAGAHWLARKLGRPLVVDWRGQTQLRDKSLNYFTEFFDPPAQIDGVPIVYAPAPEVGDYDPSSPEARWLKPGEAHAVGAGSAPGSRYLVLQTYHGLDRLHPGPEAERFRLLRSFYRHLRPSTPIEENVERWWAERCSGNFVVGVNVRTGNGRYFGKEMKYADRVDISIFEDRRRFLRLLERACRARARRLPKPLRSSFLVFYATDSAWMSELLAGLPNAVTRRTVFPPPGSGDTYAFEGPDYSDRDGVHDTLADMFLLARCDALVYNSSLFNQYARVLTGCFGGNQVHIETLFLRKRARYVAAAIRRRIS